MLAADYILDMPMTQHYCCVTMIPDFVDIGGPWLVLPPGMHNATMEEVRVRFAISDRRKSLFSGFEDAVVSLRNAGCRAILLDGSFVTAKPIPGDFDVCWETAGVNATKLDPVFLDFSDGRKKQKERFGGEFFPADAFADTGHDFRFRDYFQIDKYTGEAKGIVCIRFS
ncbi:MAG: hypothetical protein ABFE01_06315 [Phycisphaerales bacterium]|jgi:hypothetical protein